MPELPQPVHVAILSLGFAVVAFIITIAQRLGDWRSKWIARALGVLAVLLVICWVYLGALWVFKLDLRVPFTSNSEWFWIIIAGISLLGTIVAIVTSRRRLSDPKGDDKHKSAVPFHGNLETKVVRSLKPPDPPPPPLSGLAETLSSQLLQATEEEIPVQLRTHREGIVISVRQVQSSEKALPARVVVSDIRPFKDGKRITSRLLHSDTGRFSYDAIQLQRAPGVQGDLHYGEEGVWWLVCPIKGMQNLLMFWPDRGFRPIQLQPGVYIAELRIWVGDRNVPFQAAWSIDAEQRATIS
jgi:hypothetical protein